MKEGASINKSLLTLGTVINKLSEGVAAQGERAGGRAGWACGLGGRAGGRVGRAGGRAGGREGGSTDSLYEGL